MCPCPGASCKWQGSLDNVMQHLWLAHKSITTLQGEDIVFLATDITLPGAVDWVRNNLVIKTIKNDLLYLGYDAILFRTSFYACIRKTRTTIFRYCTINR
jgi:hypothetical protein